MSGAAGLLLAAGMSTRMGTPKALLDWRGQPLVRYQVEQLRAAGCDPVVVVLGHEQERIAATLEGSGACIVDNPHYAEGRATSVRAGANAIPTTASAIVVLNVDQPREAALIRALLEALHESGAAIATPAYAGRHGHPVVFAGWLLDEIAAVDEASEGLRAVVRRHQHERLILPWPDAAVTLDLNDLDAYERARRLWGSSV